MRTSTRHLLVALLLAWPATAAAQDDAPAKAPDAAPEEPAAESAPPAEGDPAPKVAAPGDVAAARDLAKKGLAFSRDKRWPEAVDALERSLALHRAPVTLYALGVAYKEVGRRAEALETLRQFLAVEATVKMQPFQAPARGAVAELEPLVAHVILRVEPEGIEDLKLTLDGKAVPTAALGLPRLVNPGERTLSATAAGYQDASKTVTLAEGDTTEVMLTLELAPVDALPPPRDAAVSPAPVESGFPTIPVVILGAGVVILGAGITVGLIGLSEGSDAPTRDGPEASAARDKTIAGDVIASVGGVAAAAGLTWLLIEVLADDSAESATLRPWSDGAAFGAELRF